MVKVWCVQEWASWVCDTTYCRVERCSVKCSITFAKAQYYMLYVLALTKRHSYLASRAEWRTRRGKKRAMRESTDIFCWSLSRLLQSSLSILCVLGKWGG